MTIFYQRQLICAIDEGFIRGFKRTTGASLNVVIFTDTSLQIMQRMRLPITWLQISASSDMIGRNNYEAKESQQPRSPRFLLVYHQSLDINLKSDLWTPACLSPKGCLWVVDASWTLSHLPREGVGQSVPYRCVLLSVSLFVCLLSVSGRCVMDSLYSVDISVPPPFPGCLPGQAKPVCQPLAGDLLPTETATFNLDELAGVPHLRQRGGCLDGNLATDASTLMKWILIRPFTTALLWVFSSSQEET